MRILVVDDERAIRNSLKEILGDEGFDVDVAEDGDSLEFSKGAGQIAPPEERVHMELRPARNQWSAPRAPAPGTASAD